MRFNESQLGYSTLEILIAFAILIMSLSAIIAVSFGSQTVAVDSQTNDEALYKAQKQLEDARALSRENFLAVDTINYDYDNGYYFGSTTITDISQCIKKVVSHLTWNREGRPQRVEFLTLLSDWKVPFLIGDTCSADEINPDSWKYPEGFGSLDLGTTKGKDIDVKDGIVYVSATKGNNDNEEDFFVIKPPYGDLDRKGIDTGGPGINEIDFVENLNDSGRNYVFVANLKDDEQFQIIDVTDADSTPILDRSCSLPGVGNSYPEGRSIFYYKQKVYIGTWETAGNEFHIYDVSDITKNCNAMWAGSKEVNHSINAIIVRDQYVGSDLKTIAYLATTGDTKELLIYDVTDPKNINEIGSFNAGSNGPNDRNGISLDLIGNKIYLGREGGSASRHNFFVVDVTNPVSPTQLGSVYINQKSPGVDINSVLVRSNLAFFGTDDANGEFQVWNVSNPLGIVPISEEKCPNLQQMISAIDFENNIIFAAFRSNDVLKLIKPGTSCK